MTLVLQTFVLVIGSATAVLFVILTVHHRRRPRKLEVLPLTLFMASYFLLLSSGIVEILFFRRELWKVAWVAVAILCGFISLVVAGVRNAAFRLQEDPDRRVTQLPVRTDRRKKSRRR